MVGTLLVIDDQLTVRENVSELLELAGHQVIQAKNGVEGIRMAKAHLPDMIICDIMMPELDGYSVADVLGRQKETAAIPLIFLTAKSEKEDFRKGLERGAVDYITKPFESVDLLETVEMRLGKLRLSKPVSAGRAAWENWAKSLNSNEPKSLTGKHLHVCDYAKNDTIYLEGDQSKEVYFVIKGGVRLERLNSRGKRICSGVMRAGNFFGYAPGFQEGNHIDGAVAIEQSIVVRIPQSEFLPMFSAQPELAVELLRQIMKENETLGIFALSMAYGSAKENTARALLHFAEEIEGDLVVRLSRDDLANSVGMAPESISRTLAIFKAEDVIETHGRAIHLLDVDSLEDELG
ncbi:MAG: response regulator [Flavobacteriales bacterium]|jgi:CheY-like chemotaxis protein|nr:response regulator [Flavobacteriales bacterium]MBT6174485.1 response regulator [Flavobacteriales bacterium]MBT7652176.1 response regulator [Flavobacteriales bacterium]